MIRRLAVLLLVLGAPLWGQYLSSVGSTQLECAEETWVGSTGPVANHASDNCKGGVPLAEADHITCGGSSGAFCSPGTYGTSNNVPSNLRLENSSHTQLPTQFRVTGIWPRTGYAKWLLIDTEVSPTVGSKDYTTFLCIPGVGSCGAAGGNTSGTLATDNGSTITIATGAATFVIQKANFDGFHDALIGSTHVILASNHGANDGITLLGPAPGTMPGAVSCLTAGNLDITACSTLYRSNQDASSTCTIEENGPVRAVLKCTGNLANGATNYLQYTARMEFYAGKTYAKVGVILRNAQTSACVATKTCSNDFNVANKMYDLLDWRETMNLASGTRSVSFAGTPSGSGATTSFPLTTASLSSTLSTDYAYLYQAYSSVFQLGDWTQAANCNGNNMDWCVDSYVDKLNNQGTYAQTGWVIKSSQTLTGSVSGTQSAAAGGYADIQDSAGAGVLIGVKQLSANWTKSLEYRSGGSELRIGIWPDQTEWTDACPAPFVDGTATPCHRPYAIYWTTYQNQDLFFDFHAAALSNGADDFLKFQHPLTLRATPGGATPANGGPAGAGAFAYYNAAKDATSGLLALPVEIPDPVAEDTYYKTLPGAFWCATPTVGNCIPDVGSSLASPGMTLFRSPYNWGAAGGGNQHDYGLGDELLYVQRGLTGMLVFAQSVFRMLSENGLPRSDFAGGWRSASNCPALNCPADNSTTGFPSGPGGSPLHPVNAQFGMRNYSELVEGGSDGAHQHVYGYFPYYFLSGDEDAREQILEGFKDEFLNQNIYNNNPYQAGNSSNGYQMPVPYSRRVGHLLASDAGLSETLRTLNDADKDTIAAPTALLAGENWLANQTHDAFMSLVGESEPPGCTWSSSCTANGCTGPFYGAKPGFIECSHGISRKRGLTWFGADGDSGRCPPGSVSCNEGNFPPTSSDNMRNAKPFMLGILAYGIRQFELAASDVFGPGWSAGNGGIPAINALASIPSGTLFGDAFLHSMGYTIAKAQLTEAGVNASGLVSCSGSALSWVDGHQFTSGMNAQTITVNEQSYTFTYSSATSGTVSPACVGGPLTNVAYLWSGFGWTGTSDNNQTSGLPYFVAEDFPNTIPGGCSSTSTSTTCGITSGGTFGRNCPVNENGACTPQEMQWLWAGIADTTGTTVDMSGNSWRSQTTGSGSPISTFDTYINHTGPDKGGQYLGAEGDASQYPMWGPMNYILHKLNDATAPTQLKDLTITGGTCVASGGQCTITFTPPSDVVAHDGLTAILKYTSDGTTVLADNIRFDNHNTTTTNPSCVANAASDPNNPGIVVGCWLDNPATSTSFWAANDVVTEPTLASGTYTLTGLTNGTTYHFRLKYYGNGAVASTFNLQLIVNQSGNGTVTSSPAGINTNSGQTVAFNSGTVVTLTAAAAPSFHFLGWMVDGNTGTCPGTGSCAVTMSANHSVTANFASSSLTPTGMSR